MAMVGSSARQSNLGSWVSSPGPQRVSFTSEGSGVKSAAPCGGTSDNRNNNTRRTQEDGQKDENSVGVIRSHTPSPSLSTVRGCEVSFSTYTFTSVGLLVVCGAFCSFLASFLS